MKILRIEPNFGIFLWLVLYLENGQRLLVNVKNIHVVMNIIILLHIFSNIPFNEISIFVT